MTTNTFGKLIDNTLIHGPGSTAEIERICREAVQLNLHGVSVPSCWVRHCSQIFKEEAEKHSPPQPASTLPMVTAIIGHPWGEECLQAKLEEIREAGRAGAKCVEFVPNMGLFFSGAEKAQAFREEIVHASCSCREMEMNCRAVLCLRHQRLQQSSSLKEELCRLARSVGVVEMQPTTGWDHDHTHPDDIAFLRGFFGQEAIIKAGNAFNLTVARKMLYAGANLVAGNGAVIVAQVQAETNELKPAAHAT